MNKNGAFSVQLHFSNKLGKKKTQKTTVVNSDNKIWMIPSSYQFMQSGWPAFSCNFRFSTRKAQGHSRRPFTSLELSWLGFSWYRSISNVLQTLFPPVQGFVHSGLCPLLPWFLFSFFFLIVDEWNPSFLASREGMYPTVLKTSSLILTFSSSTNSLIL